MEGKSPDRLQIEFNRNLNLKPNHNFLNQTQWQEISSPKLILEGPKKMYSTLLMTEKCPSTWEILYPYYVWILYRVIKSV